MLQKESKAGKKTDLARAKHKHLVKLQEELLPWRAISATFCSAAAAGGTSVHQYSQTSSISADFPPIALFHLQSHCSYMGLALRSPDGARQGEEQQRQEPCEQPCTRVCTAGQSRRRLQDTCASRDNCLRLALAVHYINYCLRQPQYIHRD